MAVLTIQNFDDDLNQLLQAVAVRRGHSIEEEVRDILKNALTHFSTEPHKKAEPTGKKLSARFEHIGNELTLPTRSLPRDLA
jgi:plasmid stability protein